MSNENFFKIKKGAKLVPETGSTVANKGDLATNDTSSKVEFHNGSTASAIVTETHASQGASRLKNKDLEDSSTAVVDSSDPTIKIKLDAAGTTGTSTTLLGSQTTDRILTLPNATDTLVGKATSDVLTNKTIDGDDNTLQDISVTSLKTDAGNPSTFISRDGSGVIISTKAVPTGAVVGTSDSQVLTNKTIDGDDNTVSDLPITSLKTNLAAASTFLSRDASGVPISTKAVPTGTVVGTSDNQVLTNKTIDGDDNTISDLAITSLKTDLPAANTFISRNGAGVPISTKVVPTGTVIGTSDSQVLTNKDIDGGTASNTNRITVPKNTKANLNSLTRKEATILYASDEDKLYIDDGSVLNQVGSNLTWNVVTGSSQALATNNAYIANSASQIDFTLPATAAVGDYYVIVGKGSGGWKVSTGAAQALYKDVSTTSGTGSYLSSDSQHSCVEIVCITANTEFEVRNSQGSTSAVAVGRGLFALGYVSAVRVNNIDHVIISTTGNATDFGDLTVARLGASACANSTRGLFGGGDDSSFSNVIDYVSIASTGNATDFGDLTVARSELTACSNETRGLFAGGTTGSDSNVIDYVTIASTGNATDFGDLTVAGRRMSACSSTTRALFGGRNDGGNSNVIDYVTIASTGNATDFGDLTVARSFLAACSSATRGLFGGGVVTSTANNTIDYVTIASTGNATDFGDLTVARWGIASCSSATRGLWAGGTDGGSDSNVIDYVTIASTGNATDFGDLTNAAFSVAGCSNAHGGL